MFLEGGFGRDFRFLVFGEVGFVEDDLVEGVLVEGEEGVKGWE